MDTTPYNCAPGTTLADIDGEPERCECGGILRGGRCRDCDAVEYDKGYFVEEC